MTKCHIILAIMATVMLADCCAPKQQGPSLSDYANSPQAQQKQFQARIAEQRNLYYDPNSPYRDEERYIPVLEEILSSPYADSAQKAQAAFDLPRFSLNRIGKPAADFSFTLRNGRNMKLSDVAAEFILLFFSNPGCANCKEIGDIITSDPIMKSLIGKGSLKVVNIYPDADIDAWMEYVSNYPAEWISGFAPEIDDAVAGSLPLYNLRAIPTLYLLNSRRCTILKDAPLERIISYLEETEHR